MLPIYLSVHLSPDKITILAFSGFAYPFLLFVNFAFVVYRALRKQKLIFISLAALLLGWNHFTDFFALNFSQEKASSNSIKVLSYNVRLFNLYKWDKNKNVKRDIFKILRQENPDIICMQEYYSCRENGFSVTDSILDIQKSKRYYIAYSQASNPEKSYGTAIFSRFPIIGKGRVDFGSKNKKCIYVDIQYLGDTVRVYSIHLASYHLEYEDYKFMNEMSENENDENVKGIISIKNKMQQSFVKQSKEADAISSHISNSPYPVILCGDFNQLPVSYVYRKIKTGLKDAFIESGNGFGVTYIRNLSFFRIDYIFHSKEFIALDYKKISQELSDHYPIVCKIQLK